MAVIRIVNGWEKLTPLNLVGESRYIISQMSGNVNFPTTDPTLATMTTLTNDLETAITDADAGGSYDRDLRDEKAQELIDALHQLGDYVVFTAKGNRLIAQSSGFTLAKTPSPNPPIEKPTGLQLFDGVNAGELLLRFLKVKGARGYMYQIAEGPFSETMQWTTAHGTIRQNLFTGLTSGKQYWVRVVALGIDGQVVYSDAVARIAQ
ncbi:MAG: hypothetical protein ACTHMD_01670 [Flavisolibacter sp.]